MRVIKMIKECVLFKECFEYFHGCLKWKKRPRHHFGTARGMNIFNSLRAGMVAGTENTSKNSSTSYIAIEVNGKAYKAHRIIWTMHNGQIPDLMMIDHIDGNGLNNRIENLRLVDRFTSASNKPKQVSNTSGVVGVNWHSSAKKWQARISSHGQRLDLGRFDNFNEAVEARKEAEKVMRFHSNHGR